MEDKDLGLIEKYVVERADGKLVRWCFVLEDTDPLAVPALRAYADAAEQAGYVKLATDLRIEADRMPLPRLEWESLPDNGSRSAEDDWMHRVEPR